MNVIVLIFGIAVIAGGAFLTYWSQDKTVITAGTFFTSMGGVICSWVISEYYAKKQAETEFGNQLGSLSRALGQIAGEMNVTVNQALDQQLLPQTTFLLIAQGVRMIYGQVGEISLLQGGNLDYSLLVENKKKAIKVTEDLQTKGIDLYAIKDNATANSSTFFNAVPSYEKVRCPFCSESNEILIGSAPGYSSTGNVCRNCNEIFNVHRSADGIFTRPVGGVDKEKIAIECINCKSYKITTLKIKGTTLVCLKCNHSMVLNENFLPKDGGEFKRVEAKIIGRRVNRPLLECPVCSKQQVGIVPYEDCYCGFCFEHQSILYTSCQNFDVWCETHKDETK